MSDYVFAIAWITNTIYFPEVAKLAHLVAKSEQEGQEGISCSSGDTMGELPCLSNLGGRVPYFFKGGS